MITCVRSSILYMWLLGIKSEYDLKMPQSHTADQQTAIQEGLLSVTSKSMCTQYWLTACLKACQGKSVVR